jgi:filamentous hemagglutinin family protein
MPSLLCKTATNPICIAGSAIATLVALISPVFAQITPDETLGHERSQVNRNVQVRGALGDRIAGGATRGSNLFHSFQEFNVNEGQRVYFGNPNGIENILSRVTGRDVSDIMGTLGVDGAANLFLLNPNGIIFGPNARLDVSGSFLASGGDRFTFSDGSEFSAANPQAPPLLSVNVPLGLQYGTDHPGNIANQGHLITGQDLTLTGNQLNLQGLLQAGRDLNLLADQTLQIRDSTLHPFIAAAGGTMRLQGNQLIDIFALNHPLSGLFSGGDMLLRSPHPVSGDARYSSGGSFRVEELTGAAGDLFSLYDPVILTLGDVFYGDYTGPSLHILAGGNVTLDDVVITNVDTVGNSINPITFPNLASVLVSDGTVQAIDGSVQATLDVRAGIDWNQIPGGFPGLTVLGTLPPPILLLPATGSDITINSIRNRELPNSLVLLTNQFFPNLGLPAGNIRLTGAEAAFGNSISAFGGTVTLDARNDIQVPAGIDASIDVGFGGDIRLLSGNIIDTRGRNLVSGSGNGSGGNISLSANGDILTSAFQSLVLTGVGNGGNVDVKSRNGSITILGFVESASGANGLGNGGNITLDALGDIVVSNTLPGPDGTIPALSSFVSLGGTGNGGDIRVTSREGEIDTRSGRVSSATDNGFGGNIVFDAADRVTLATLESFSSGFGDGGSVSVTSRNADVRLIPGGTIAAQTFGSGRGGDVTVNARSIFLPGASIAANTYGTGNAGNINVNAESLFLSELGSIQAGVAIFPTTSRIGTGNAGTVTIQLSDQLSMTGSSAIRGLIEAGAGSPTTQGASIDIQARSLFLTGGSQITSGLFRATEDLTGNPIQGGQGIGGDIRVTAIDSVLLSGYNEDGFSSGLLAISERGAAGAAGNVYVDVPTGTLRVENGAAIFSNTLNDGDAGEIVVNARTLEVLNGGRLLAATLGTGDAQNITVSAGDRILIANADPNFTDRIDRINAYLLRPEAGSDTIEDIFGGVVRASSGIFANTIGLGLAGNITLTSPTMTMSDLAFVTTDTRGDANAGNIDITSQTLTLSAGAEVLALTSGGAGIAGNITVRPLDPTAPSSVTLTGVAPAIEFADGSVGGFSSGLFTASGGDAIGAGGDISVTTGILRIDNGATLSARTRTIGNGGDITVNVDSLEITNGGQLISTAFSSGTAGNITVNATGAVTIAGSDEGFSDRRDAIQTIFTNRGLSPIEALEETLEILDPTSSLSGLQAQSLDETGTGSGEILITAGSLSLADGANLNTRTVGSGDAGKIQITTNALSITDEAVLNTTTIGSGNAGAIEIRTGSLFMANEARLNSSTFGTGNAGDIFIRAAEAIDLSNADLFSTVEPGGVANSGTITLRANTLTLRDGAQIQTLVREAEIDETTGTLLTPAGQGNGGNIDIQVRGNIRLVGIDPDGFSSLITSQIGEGAIGSGGNITVESRRGSLFLLNGGRINASQFGQGRGGNIDLDIARDIELSGISVFTNSRGRQVTRNSRIASQLGDSGLNTSVGRGGDLDLKARSLFMTDGSVITASTFATGNAGNVNIQVDDSMTLLGSSNGLSGIRALVEAGGDGRGGDITIQGRSLFLDGGSFISASLFRAERDAGGSITTPGAIGRGGDIRITTTDFVNLSGSGVDFTGQERFTGLRVSTESGATGPAGNIRITTGNLFVTDNAIISARTDNASNAGDVRLTVANGLLLANNGRVLIDSTREATGDPGNLVIRAGSVLLDQGGRLQAETTSGANANITIRTDGDLVMQGTRTAANPSCPTCSEISTEARGTGEGGNILIEAGFILGNLVENSDVVANAFDGPGGAVDARAAVVGFRQFEDRRTRSSDLTASSELGVDGTVDIEEQQQFEVQLPVDRIDPATLITDRCAIDAGLAADEALGSFTVTGRGGLPPNPLELIDGETVFTRLADSERDGEMESARDGEIDEPSITSSRPSAAQIVEAQGWVVDEKGQITLVAATPTTPDASTGAIATCASSRSSN